MPDQFQCFIESIYIYFEENTFFDNTFTLKAE